MNVNREKPLGYDPNTIFGVMNTKNQKDSTFCVVVGWYGKGEPADFIECVVNDGGGIEVKNTYSDGHGVESVHLGNYVIRKGKVWGPNDRIPEQVKVGAERTGLDVRSDMDRINSWIDEVYAFSDYKPGSEVASLNDSNIIRIAVCKQMGTYREDHPKAGKPRYVPVGAVEVTKSGLTGKVTEIFLDTLGVEEGQEFFLIRGEIPEPLFVPLRDNRFLPRTMEVLYGFVNEEMGTTEVLRMITNWVENGVHPEGHPKAGKPRYVPVGAVELQRSEDGESATVTKILGDSQMEMEKTFSLIKGNVPRPVFGALNKNNWWIVEKNMPVSSSLRESMTAGEIRKRARHVAARAARVNGPIAQNRPDVKGKNPRKAAAAVSSRK